jgi:hypothetical protein
MGGGLLQLVAYGAQDAYLSGNPQITFWRGLFKRHTNFAMEPFRVNMTGQASWGTKHSAILTRYADLVSSGYIEVELAGESPGVQLIYDSQFGSDRRSGFNLVKYVELDIGGQIIDRQYGEFMYLWSTLAYPFDGRRAMDQMAYTSLTNNAQCSNATGRPVRQNLTYIPLMFFFCRNPGAALPLIALQYHEVKINIMWNDAKLIYRPDVPPSLTNGPAQANLLIDYIYLDVEERRRMAQESHEYLIEQTQFNEDNGLTSAQNRVDLTFNHPVKELIWVTQRSYRRNCRFIGPPISNSAYLPLDYDPIIYDCNLQLNGQDRMQFLPGNYFTNVQLFQHHSGDAIDGVYMYSFAIKPEEHQPSGTCNFSRIDSATLVFNVDGSFAISNADVENADVRVYAINYNILRVMSGMGGLAYSN